MAFVDEGLAVCSGLGEFELSLPMLTLTLTALPSIPPGPVVLFSRVPSMHYDVT